VFLALSSRLEAVSGEVVPAPPAAPPEVAAAPADLAATAGIEPAAIDPQPASPELPGPALARDLTAPCSGAADVAQGEAAAVSPAPDQAATAPAGPQASGVSVSGTSTKNARAPDRSRVPPRHARRRLLRDRPGLAMRRLILPRRNIQTTPARLLCYSACAGPPALLRRA
jgi:hypothetical protein